MLLTRKDVENAVMFDWDLYHGVEKIWYIGGKSEKKLYGVDYTYRDEDVIDFPYFVIIDWLEETRSCCYYNLDDAVATIEDFKYDSPDALVEGVNFERYIREYKKAIDEEFKEYR